MRQPGISVSLAAGSLAFRFCDGFARNALLANQIALFQSLAGLGANGAQRAAKFLSASCSVAPLLVGALPLSDTSLFNVVFFGCCLELLCIAATAITALHAWPEWPTKGFGPTVFCTLFVAYSLGYGAVVSVMPMLTRKSAPEGALCSGLMQAFVASLSAGAILGIAAAAAAAASNSAALGPIAAFLCLILGMATFPPLGGLPLKVARCILKAGLRLGPAELLAWEQKQPANRLLSSPAPSKAAVPGGSLVSLLPPLLLLFPFYAAASQWTTSWYVQTLYCDRCVFGIVIPACLLQGFERLASLAVLTWLRSRTTVLRLKLPKRLGLGSVCAALAMLAAALVEVARRDWTPRLPGEPEVSSLSVAWLLPQFALIAAGEAFIYPASAEFLSSSPFAYGLGCAAQAGAVALLGLWLGYLKAWIPDGSPNQGHYDLFYLCLGGAGLVAGGLFVLLPFPTF